MKQTAKRWQFAHTNDAYLRRQFDDLAEHLIGLEQRLASSDTTEYATEASVESLSSEVASLSTQMAVLRTQLAASLADSRLVELGIGDLTIPEGHALLLFDGEQLSGTLKNNGLAICI